MANPITEMKQIVNNYDSFLIDLWGVIHDGTVLYPDAINALNLLKSNNKQVIFLSNGPRRAHKAKTSLSNFGIKEDLYLDVMTSGEFLYNKITNLYPQNSKFYYIGPEFDSDLFNGLNYFRTQNLKEASFILNCGLFDAEAGLTNEIEILKEASDLNLVMLCPNPDIIVIKQTGEEFFCAGYVAQQYENIGGKVNYFGKPFKELYTHLFQLFNLDPKKTLAIGDSLYTDIGGANNIGIDSILITGGIHSNELKLTSLEDLYKNYKQKPNLYLEKFK